MFVFAESIKSKLNNLWELCGIKSIDLHAGKLHAPIDVSVDGAILVVVMVVMVVVGHSGPDMLVCQ